MNQTTKLGAPSRRALLKTGGALVVSIGAAVPFNFARAAEDAMVTGAKPPLTPDRLSSYIAVNADGTVSAFYGKIDGGQGLHVAIAQMVAEELDVPFKAVKVVMGDTATSVNQGGASGATGVQNGGKQLRAAAAEARRVLVELAAEKLGAPAERLSVDGGVVHTGTEMANSVSYAELIGGRYFNVALAWNGKIGNPLYAPGKAKPKDPKNYKIVGQPIKREDVAPLVFAQQDFCTDVKVPGMVHGRMVRPAIAGAMPVSVDESSIKDIPGARVVWNQGFLGIVADKEWDAIKAAQQLKVTWSNATPPFPEQASLYDHIRKAPVRKREVAEQTGNVDEAFKGAARVIEAEYEWPFQSHASMGPACAVVEIKNDQVTLWTGSQKPHFTRDGVAAILGLPAEKVRAIWVPGPGSYGRNDAGDAAMDAALLANAVGRPVRLQYTRDQGTGWDPKGPASIHRVRAAIDAAGKVIAYEFGSKAFPRVDVNSNESKPHDTLAGQLTGVALQSGDGFGEPEDSYGFANKRAYWETVAPLLDRGSPLRTSHLRDPIGPQVHFASESFMDEVATALKLDPVAFRLQYVTDPRDIAVIKAAAEKAGWQSRVSPGKDQRGTTVSGRGIAYVQRHPTRVAMVAEVEVDRSTGKVWVRKFTVAHDCGQIINPDGLRQTIEGNVVQAISRTLWEEVRFNNKNVTSVDWLSYPILDITQTPEMIDVVLIDRPEIAPTGAGEPATRPVAAAIANAVFDATGVRIRRVPFLPDYVKAALS
ncbi:MAG TPA: molybdopterin cofactor-binding domain-containing protein [Xanthobacteraceae bacterium]|nr:molybdopterin cofactor-binding domain-containing protein [Xanthobacteraceae bacterium]